MESEGDNRRNFTRDELKALFSLGPAGEMVGCTAELFSTHTLPHPVRTQLGG